MKILLIAGISKRNQQKEIYYSFSTTRVSIPLIGNNIVYTSRNRNIKVGGSMGVMKEN